MLLRAAAGREHLADHVPCYGIVAGTVAARLGPIRQPAQCGLLAGCRSRAGFPQRACRAAERRIDRLFQDLEHQRHVDLGDGEGTEDRLGIGLERVPPLFRAVPLGSVLLEEWRVASENVIALAAAASLAACSARRTSTGSVPSAITCRASFRFRSRASARLNSKAEPKPM